MGSSNPASLDEVVFSHPPMYNNIGGIFTNTVLPYFAESPFYDPTSNNAALTVQCFANQSMYHLLQTREAFEGRLRTMQGLEFMVIHDPSENDTKKDHSGVWVIRKQTRRKRAGLSDEVTPISCYYVVGMHVYMASTMGNILNSRLLTATSCLNKLVSTAFNLQSFSPATGNAYLPSPTKNPTPGSSFRTAQSSKEGTPMPGSSTPLPGGTQDTTSSKGPSASKSSTENDPSSVQMLADSYSLSLRYGNEYMDENPLIGEPGSFRLANAKGHETGLTASQTTNKTSAQSSLRISTPAPSSVKDTPTPQLKTEDLPAPARKGTKGAEKSPITPASAITNAKEKKDRKERKKSKAAGSGETMTPVVTTPKAEIPK